jgi:ComF family protein
VLDPCTAFVRRALPQQCALCAARAGGALLCPACAAALPRPPPACPVCALPTPAATVCGACATGPPPYVATVAATVYEWPVDRLLQRLKYGGHFALADWAGGMLAAAVRVALGIRAPIARPDVVVALPLAPARQRNRGFNQAQEIAARAARSLALPLGHALQRHGNGPPQAALPWRARRQNVHGAFTVRGEVRGARVALVDDVMTTGATLAEAAHVLRVAGAARVECWVVARTLPPAVDAHSPGDFRWAR